MSLTDRGMYLSKAVNQIFILKLSSVQSDEQKHCWFILKNHILLSLFQRLVKQFTCILPQ